MASGWRAGLPGRRGVAVVGALVLDDAETRDDVAATLTARAEHDAPGLRVVVVGRVDEVWWPAVRAGLPGRAGRVGPEHPDVLSTRHDLAAALGMQDHHVEAEAEFRSVFALRTRLLGLDHPDTLDTRRNLAHVHRVLGLGDIAG